jgi:hypothetical protein
MIDRHTFPANGWVFRQPQTGWTNPAPIGNTFDQTVQLIIKHRKANPAITAKFALATNPEKVAWELEMFTRKRLGIPEDAPVPFPGGPSSLPGGVAAAAGDRRGALWGIKRAAAGTAVVLDWLMSGGKPVAQDLANKRAAICASADNWVDEKGQAQTRCRNNVEGAWFTTSAAEIIRATLSARSDLKLQTPYDDKLKSCDVCKCLMALKCWTPMGFILNHTKPDIFIEYPDWCWIKKRDQGLT